MNTKICTAICTALLGIAVSAAAMAQSARIDIPDFGPLKTRATDCVDINLGPSLLHTLGLFMDDTDPESAATKKLLRGIRSIRVRSFQFDSDSAYSRADVDAVRTQLRAPGWTSMLTVHDRDRGEDVDMYMLIQNEQTRGFALIASQPREFTIINIEGSVDLSDVAKLQKELHLGKAIPGQDARPNPAAAQF